MICVSLGIFLHVVEGLYSLQIMYTFAKIFFFLNLIVVFIVKQAVPSPCRLPLRPNSLKNLSIYIYNRITFIQNTCNVLTSQGLQQLVLSKQQKAIQK